MSKADFFKKNDEQFLSLGFKKDIEDPMFFYSKQLISEEVAEENDLSEDEIPCLLFGNSGINRGFCVYTGGTFVWINAQTPQEAVDFASQIVAFEPNF